MYLFLPFTACTPSTSCRTLHSTMYLFLHLTFHIAKSKQLLYIPQCIYFYTRQDKRLFKKFVFTFHNVSISTWQPSDTYKGLCLYIPQCIYFYNDTDRIIARLDATLHSTMYLFLLNPHKRVSLVCYSLHSTMYLFLRFSDIVIPAYALLYIPQCIYFYPSSYALEVPFSEPLHSTMYLFLLFRPWRIAFPNKTLHSTMYLFLLRFVMWKVRFGSSLHSTMYLFLRIRRKIILIGLMLYIPQCIYFYISRKFAGLSTLSLYIPQCIYFYSFNPDTDGWGTYFTFHNVSISTWIRYLIYVTVKKLYIPQCIYFYLGGIGVMSAQIHTLHSTMYLFLLHLRSLPAPSVLSLHSTMYLFLPG